MKDGVELNKETAGSRYRFKKDGKRHILIVNEATKDDIGTYHALTNGGESKAELEVEGTGSSTASLLASISDVAVCTRVQHTLTFSILTSMGRVKLAIAHQMIDIASLIPRYQ